MAAPAWGASNDAPEAKPGSVNFRYIYALLRANLRLVVSVFLSCLALTVLVTLLQTPRYEAQATIQINNSTERLVRKATGEDDDEEVGAQADVDRFLKTQVDVIKSRMLALRVSQRLNLMNNPAFYKAEGAKAPQSDDTPAKREYQFLRVMSKNLDVDLPRDTRVAKITFVSADPKLAADIANAYAQEFIQTNLRRKFDSTSYARDFLARQLEDGRAKLETSERGLNEYARSAGLIRTQNDNGGSGKNDDTAQSGTSVTEASLVLLNHALADAKARRITAEGRWHAISGVPLMSATEVVSNLGINQLLTQKAQIDSALQEEKVRHLDSYPTVQSKEAQLASINQLLKTTATNIRNAVQSEYQASVLAERDLETQVDHLKNATLNEQDRDVTYGLLAREVDTNRQLYDGLLQRYKELNASAGVSESNVSIVDAAYMPVKPSSPNIPINLLVGLLAAILVTAIVLTIKDQFDDSVRIPEDIGSKLHLSLLGVVPVVNDETPAEVLGDQKSQLSEAYNSIRGSLLFATQGGLPKSVMITSAQPAEGKSTSSYAIALSLARMGKSVVLIDADMRRPSLHRLIDNDNQRGLSTLLTSHDEVQDYALRHAEVPTLHLIPSGPIPPSPTELLSGSRMNEILRQAEAQFDVAILDAPPILGLADAPTLAAIVKGVAFVVEADRSRHGALKSALGRLRAVHANLLGGVLTKFDALRSGNRYSSYYGYEYYQYQYTYSNDQP